MSRAADFLRIQYQQKKNKNSRYSQRAFARLIEVNAGRLTQYFAGDRLVSKAAAQRIGAKLNLDREQQDYFSYLCEFDQREKRSPNPRQLQDDELALIVEWYHFAILSLVSTKDFQFDFGWIADRLGITKAMVQSSWERLVRIGMVQVDEGQVTLNETLTTTTSDIPNKFIMLSHQDSLRQIVDHLPKVPTEKRDVTSITLAVDSKKIKEAKNMIRTFRRKLAGFLSQGKKDEVYTINVQLFPLTKAKKP
jgi:uncharacterized protein (TIGR02147 family)